MSRDRFDRRPDNMSQGNAIRLNNLADSAYVRIWLLTCFGQAVMQESNREWLASEHQRLHNVERWPDTPRKHAVLGAIQSTLDSLSRHPGTEQAFACFICQSRNTKVIVLEPQLCREPAPIVAARAEWQKTG
jgi:hypothetical protein